MQDKPKLGQHWLKDEAVLKDLVVAAKVKPGDTILEVGPGQGALTDKLAAAGASVTAVELDAELAAKLAKSFKDSRRIKIINEDIRRFDLSAMPPGYKVAANIPYYLTAPLIRKLIEDDNPPARMALLVQKEVAQRLAADPGDLSVLGVAVQMVGRVELVRTVTSQAFSPPPKVESAIVAITIGPSPGQKETDGMMKLVKHGFANKRKTLANSLAAGLNIPKEQAASLIKKAGLAANIRAQDLSLRDWKELYNRWQRNQT